MEVEGNLQPSSSGSQVPTIELFILRCLFAGWPPKFTTRNTGSRNANTFKFQSFKMESPPKSHFVKCEIKKVSQPLRCSRIDLLTSQSVEANMDDESGVKYLAGPKPTLIEIRCTDGANFSNNRLAFYLHQLLRHECQCSRHWRIAGHEHNVEKYE
jgi:hypothetical protein